MALGLEFMEINDAIKAIYHTPHELIVSITQSDVRENASLISISCGTGESRHPYMEEVRLHVEADIVSDAGKLGKAVESILMMAIYVGELGLPLGSSSPWVKDAPKLERSHVTRVVQELLRDQYALERECWTSHWEDWKELA